MTIWRKFMCIVLSSTMFLQTGGLAVAQTVTDRMTSGERNTISNNTASVLTGLPSSGFTEQAYDFTNTTPIIWGRYLPSLNRGYIEVTYLRKKGYVSDPKEFSVETATIADLEGNYELRREVLGPKKGELLRSKQATVGFRDTNPFTSFIPPINEMNQDLYQDISYGAFVAAVGQWAQYYSTQRGYIAVADYNVEVNRWQKKRTFGLRVENHKEASAAVRPSWRALSAANNAPFRAFSSTYRVAPCSAKPSPHTAAASRTGGTPSAAIVDSECLAFSGIGVVTATKSADIPSHAATLWHQHDWSTRWNWLAVLFFIAAVVTLGAGAFAEAAVLSGITADIIDWNSPNRSSTLASFQVLEDGTAWGLSIAMARSVVGPDGTVTPPSAQEWGRLANLGDGLKASEVTDPLWSPAYCLAVGSRDLLTQNTEPIRRGRPRHGCQKNTICETPRFACTNWLSSDIMTSNDVTGVKEMFESRKHDIKRDSIRANDVQRMQEQGSPKRFRIGEPQLR